MHALESICTFFVDVKPGGAIASGRGRLERLRAMALRRTS